jgi:RNA-directed DNA polymerase
VVRSSNLKRGNANPYDPTDEVYFEERQSKPMASNLHGRAAVHLLWKQQGGKCPVCDQGLTLAEDWRLHHLEWRVYGGSDGLYNRTLLHANGHRQVHSQGLKVEKAASHEWRS